MKKVLLPNGFNVTPACLGAMMFGTTTPKDASYASAVAWAMANGVTSGTSATEFSPDTTCTRGQIVTFLMRALK